MKLLWTAEAWEEFVQSSQRDPAFAAKIVELFKDIRRTPFAGLGKPEPLRGSLSGWWSRRITREHRLVYRVVGTEAEQRVEIVQCRYHY
ncbi:MAG: Txe/YoeB family addiction module toxin [Stellaceae bacterium]